jgi:hypothetical protein
MNDNTLNYFPGSRRPFPWKLVAGCFITAIAAVGGYFLVQWIGLRVGDWRIRRAHDFCATCVLDPGKPTFMFDGNKLSFSKGLPITDGETALETLGVGYPGDLVFAHERRTHDGSTRTVLLQVNRFAATTGTQPFFTYHVLGPGVPGDPKGLLSSDDLNLKRADGISIRPYASRPLTIYYAQADPLDQSHFWFDYEFEGKRGTVDGYLEDNPHAGWYEYVRLTDRAPK